MAIIKDVSVGAIGDDKGKLDSVVKQVNEGFRLISNEDRTLIKKDDAGTQRLLLGYQKEGFSNGSMGVKLSQEGVDVLDATSEQLIWSSDFNSFKILATGTFDSSPVGNPSAGSVLSAVDTVETGVLTDETLIVLAFYYDSGIAKPLPLINHTAGILVNGGVIGDIMSFEPYVEDGELKINFGTYNYYNGQSISSRPIRWYVLRETAVAD